MKLLTILSVIFLFHMNGFKDGEKNLLIGTWAGCLQDSTYNEISFFDSTYIYTIDGFASMPIFGYYHVINSNTVSEYGLPYKIVINYGKPDTLSLYLTDYNNMETVGLKGVDRYIKIAESNFLKFDSDPTMCNENSTYVREFNRRKIQFNCK